MKKKQKIKSAKRLLCALAFAPQTGQNHGLESFAPLAFALCPRFCKISYAPATQGHHRSARFRPKLFCRRGGKRTIPR
ncbi:hypothetical protein [Mucilaginibacter sp.]|uniref:hypothetical protein n=1 Tax=Mucilaginibacter sp. TaxID=1882438 RepID=UPI00261A9462|nr:hypothetical protein [Mucilaginibacter sp.]